MSEEARVVVEREDGTTEIIQASIGYLCQVCAEDDGHDTAGLGLCADHAGSLRTIGCPTCGAKGQVRSHTAFDAKFRPYVVRESCDTCAGLGFIRILNPPQERSAP